MNKAKNAWDPTYKSAKILPVESTTNLVMGFYEVIDRERLENDVTNVGVAAALIGGFALESLDASLGTFIYLLAVMAVHMCTCAALCSALIYRVVNKLSDDDIIPWVNRHKLLLHLPISKFAVGTLCYLLIVIVRSWYAMEATLWARYFCLAIGVGSMSMSIGTFLVLSCDTPRQRKE
jgi:hypothetical protein